MTPMRNTSDPSAAELRDELSPVSERYAAVALGPATVVFDTDDPSRWVLSDAGVPLDDTR